MTAGARQRWLASGALVCLAMFVALAVLVDQGWAPLARLDRDLGRWPEELTRTHDGARAAWLWVGRASRAWTLVPLAVVTVVVLLVRGRHRAAALVAVVMTVAPLASTLTKLVVGRERPLWDDPIQTIDSFAFPSGHATNNSAAAALAIVLALRLSRSAAVRRTVTVVAGTEALVVGADRVFLGVHHASDVLGGYLLAGAIVCAALLVLDPGEAPPSAASDPPPPERRTGPAA